MILVRRKGVFAVAIVRDRWYKADDNVTTWSGVSGEFNPGDRLWMCAQRYLIPRPNPTGVRIIIWGFSGAIINLDTGTAIVRAP